MKKSQRVPMMAAATVLLLLLVIADRAGMLPGGSSGARAEDDSAAARYEEAALAAEADEALLRRAGEWNSAAERAEAEWSRVSAGLVRAATPELAETRFREIVLAAMADIPLISTARINYIRDGAAAPPGAGAASVRTLRLSVAFDAPNPKGAYTIIDRLENMPDAQARIESLKIDGPGRVQSPKQVTVTLTLAAAAHIENAAPSAGGGS